MQLNGCTSCSSGCSSSSGTHGTGGCSAGSVAPQAAGAWVEVALGHQAHGERKQSVTWAPGQIAADDDCGSASSHSTGRPGALRAALRAAFVDILDPHCDFRKHFDSLLVAEMVFLIVQVPFVIGFEVTYP